MSPKGTLLLTTRRPQRCNDGRKMVYHAARLSLVDSYCCSQRTQQRMLLFQTSPILYNTTFPKSLSIQTLTTLCPCTWLWEHCCSSLSNFVHCVGPACSPAHPASSPEPRCPAYSATVRSPSVLQLSQLTAKRVPRCVIVIYNNGGPEHAYNSVKL